MAYERKKNEEWYHTRFIAYHSYLNISLKGKHLPIDKFLPIGEDKVFKSISEEAKEAYRKRRQEAENELKLKIK